MAGVKKIFESVRSWSGKHIKDEEIEAVLKALAHSDIYFPSDYEVEGTGDPESDNEAINKKASNLMQEITHEAWQYKDMSGQEVYDILWGLIMTARFNISETNRKVVGIRYDKKGGAKDVSNAKGLNYPVSLQRVQDVKDYLDTKNLHNPAVMFEDIKNTKRFMDIPYKVMRMIIAVYHYENGDVTAKDIHREVRREYFEVPLNKRGANIPKTERRERKVKIHKLYMHLTNDEVQKLGEELNWRKSVDTIDGHRVVVYFGDRDENQYVANDGVAVKEQDLEKIMEVLKSYRLDRVDKVSVFETNEYAKNGANIEKGEFSVGDKVRIKSSKRIGRIVTPLIYGTYEIVVPNFKKDIDDPMEELSGALFYKKPSEIELVEKMMAGGKTEGFEKLPKHRQANKKYAYFAVGKIDGKIVDAWELVSDVESLKYYAKIDLKDNDYNPKDFNIVSKAYLIKKGINPFDFDNWRKNNYRPEEEQMAKGGYVFKGDKYEYVPYKFVYTIGGL